MDLHENVLSLWFDAFSGLFSGCLEIKYYLILLTYNLLSKMNKYICRPFKHQISVLILVLKLPYQFGSQMKYFYRDLETLKEAVKFSCFFIYSWCFQQP